MKYIVSLGEGQTYEFKDSSTAMSFAEIALKYRTEDCDSVSITVTRGGGKDE